MINWGKIILGSIIVIVIGVVACLIFCRKPEPTNKFTVIVFNQQDKEQLKALVEKIKELNNGKTEDLEFTLIFPAGKQEKYIHKQSADFSFEDKFYFPQLFDSLNIYFPNKQLNNSIEEANTLIQALVQKYNEDISDKEQEFIFLVGNFPKGYNCSGESDLNNALNSLANLKKDIKNKTIVWNLSSNNEDPEQTILVTLKSKTKVIDKQISLKKRDCPATAIAKVEFAIVSRLDSIAAISMINSALKIIPPDANVNVTSMIGIKKANKFSEVSNIIFESATKTRENTFLEARTVWIQLLNSLESSKDTNKTIILFVGSVPQPTKGEITRLGGKEIITNKQQLEKLAKKKNLEFLIGLKGVPKTFNIQKYWTEKLDGMKIKNQPFNF